jgi:uncharacterized protein (UPF0332 family)
MTDENRRLALIAEWDRACEALAASEVLLAAHQPVSAASRAYYGLFHAARALLFSRGLEPITHRGVRNLIALHFVRSGLLTPELAQALSRVATLREDADYSGAAIVTIAAAEEAHSHARAFMAAAKELLEGEGWFGGRA